MPTFQFAKLVRDKIVDHQIASGAIPRYRRLAADEHKEALIAKIIEEAREIANADLADTAAEIADVQQAVDDLKELYGLTSTDITREQAIKNAKDGAFKKGLFVESVELSEDDKWTAHYRENADRYPEIKLLWQRAVSGLVLKKSLFNFRAIKIITNTAVTFNNAMTWND